MFSFLIITSIALADWKSDITKLGFYAVVSGKAIPLDFLVFTDTFMDDGTERSIPVTKFENIPSIKKDDFLVLYGDIPKGPLDTSVEVFKYTLRGSSYRYSGSAGDISDFFSLEPLEQLKGQKLLKLVHSEGINGVFALHKYVGMESDGYAGFRIGDEQVFSKTEQFPSVVPNRPNTEPSPTPSILGKQQLADVLEEALQKINDSRNANIRNEKRNQAEYLHQAWRLLSDAKDNNYDVEETIKQSVNNCYKLINDARNIYTAGKILAGLKASLKEKEAIRKLKEILKILEI